MVYEFYKPKPTDKVRLLEPQVKHTHYVFNKTANETQMLCTGPNCFICSMISKLKHRPWYVKLWDFVKRLFVR